MKYEIPCEIVCDLLPSYIDGLTSEDSTESVAAHLKKCEDCRRNFEDMKMYACESVAVNSDEKNSFKNVKRKLKRRSALTFAAALLLCLLISGSYSWYHSGHDLAPDEFNVDVHTITKSQVTMDEENNVAEYDDPQEGLLTISGKDYVYLTEKGYIEQIIVTSEKSIDSYMIDGGEYKDSVTLSVGTDNRSILSRNKRLWRSILWNEGRIDTVYCQDSEGNFDIMYQRY